MSTDDERPSGVAADTVALIKANEELRREINYRSRVEEALRADVERFRMMVGAVKDYAILMLDSAGYVASWNDGAHRITGYLPEEIVGQHFSLFYPVEDVAAGTPAVALKTASVEGRYAGEVRWLRKNETQFEASIVFTALYDGHGVLRGFSMVAQDITERKKTEATLQTQARVIEKMTESVIVADDRGHIVTINSATEKMFGFAAAELLGRHVNVLYGTCDTAALDEVTRRMESVRGGSTWIGDIERRKKDGTPIITHTQLSAFELDGKRHYYSVNDDVTERRRVAEALRASEERFSNAFELAPIGMALVGLDGRWLKVNRAICELIGYSEAALLKRTFQDVTHPEDLDADLDNIQKLLAGEISSYQMEKRYFHLRGHTVKVLLSVSLVRSLDGRPLYFVSQIQDITERKRAEEELRWKTAFLEAQVHSSRDGILVVDENGKKILQNLRMAEVWKIPQEIANDPDDRVQMQWVTSHVKNSQAFVERVVYLYEHPHEVSKEEIELTNGMILDRYSAPVLGSDGRYYGRIWTFRDISERKQLESHLLQSQKMEIVGRLAGGVAHEFNSILTVILGQSEFILNELPEDSPLKSDAKDIVKATERAAALTRQLLAYGRQQFMRADSLDLNQIIAGLESTFHLIMGSAIEVEIIPQEGLWTVKADAGQMEQAIMNLAVNAYQAMPNGGKLTLTTANVTLEESHHEDHADLKPGSYVMLTVTDTGVGMTEEVKARAFEPFFSTKDVGQGSGLGLATCYGIVKQSCGSITLESMPGKGTTFRICLPRAEIPE